MRGTRDRDARRGLSSERAQGLGRVRVGLRVPDVPVPAAAFVRLDGLLRDEPVETVRAARVVHPGRDRRLLHVAVAPVDALDGRHRAVHAEVEAVGHHVGAAGLPTDRRRVGHAVQAAIVALEFQELGLAVAIRADDLAPRAAGDVGHPVAGRVARGLTGDDVAVAVAHDVAVDATSERNECSQDDEGETSGHDGLLTNAASSLTAAVGRGLSRNGADENCDLQLIIEQITIA